MRVFVAGGTGAMGRSLLPRLVEAGHSVVATSRSAGAASAISTMGAKPAVMDGLDRASVRRAVQAAEPDAVIHQLTALTTKFDLKHFDTTFAATNRLRTEATDHLLEAAADVGAKRFIAQSYAGWNYGRSGDGLKSEDDPMDADPIAASQQSAAAIRHLEAAVTAADWLTGIVLRYGGFYGPGTGLSFGGDQLELVQRRRFPVVGSGAGVWSFIHIEDAAEATVAALESGSPGIYNIVDDEPAPVAEWLPYLASAIGAKPPRRFPTWLARPMVGKMGLAMMQDVRGVSNAKAKRELDWHPRYASWRDGFRTGLAVS